MKVCIAGGGKVGMYLAQSLLAHRHKVTIIEPQEALCRSLADALDVPVVCGDAISFDTLRTADVASCDAFVAVTFRHVPTCREAVIVCLADKYCAVLESMFQRTRVADTDAADNEW